MDIRTLFISISARPLLLLNVVASLTFLATALVAQYGFYLAPCELCMAQRYPYMAIAILGIFSAICLKSPRGLFIAVAVCALLFLLDGGIATYHSLVEMGILPAPSACSSNSSGSETIEEMRRQIMNAPLVTCDQAMLHVAGLSMAAWNALAAFFMMFFNMLQLKKLPR